MILDVTLKEKSYFLKIHKNLFENKSTSLVKFQEDSALMILHEKLGRFQISKEFLGFDGCLKLYDEDSDYLFYKFDICRAELRKFLITMHLLTFYIVEQMFDEEEFFAEGIWEDQSLSFNIFNGGNSSSSMSDYSITGLLYPWFKDKLFALSEEDLKKLNKYVEAELGSFYLDSYKREIYCSQVTICKESFFIKVAMAGRWISWTRGYGHGIPEEFNSNNMDNSCDQETSFAAIVLINTWLREN